MKEVDYTLATLSRHLLSQERQELAAADVPGMDSTALSPHTITALNESSQVPPAKDAHATGSLDIADSNAPLNTAKTCDG